MVRDRNPTNFCANGTALPRLVCLFLVGLLLYYTPLHTSPDQLIATYAASATQMNVMNLRSFQFKLSSSSVFVLLAFFSVMLIATLADGADVSVEVKSEVGGWALDEKTGRVFASLINEGVVVEYSVTGTEVRRVKVKGKPAELLVKQDKLVVACTESPSLEVIDLMTYETFGSVPAGEIGPYALFASKADNPYVYFYTWNKNKDRGGNIFRVDVNTLEVTKNDNRLLRNGTESHIVISPDGKWLLADTRWPNTPNSSASLIAFDEGKFRHTIKRSIELVTQQISADPFNRFWTIGGTTYSLDATTRLKEFGGDCTIIHPAADLVSTLHDGELKLQRFTDAQEIDTVSLADFDPVVTEARFDFTIPSFTPLLKYDLKNHIIFVGTQHHGYWIELKQFAKKIRRKSILQAPSEQVLEANKEHRLSLYINEKKATKESPIKLSQGPDDASIDEGEFVWTPTSNDIGTVSVKIELSNDDPVQSDSLEMLLHVLPPHANVDFTPNTIALSPDGKFLLALGVSPRLPNGAVARTTEVAVVDTQSMALIHRGVAQYTFDVATIDSKYIFAVAHSQPNDNLIVRFDHNLGNIVEVKDTERSPIGMTTIGDSLVAVISHTSGYYHADTLSILSKGELERYNLMEGNRMNSVAKRQKFIEIGNTVREQATGKTVRVSGTSQRMPSVVNFPRSFFTNDVQPRAWGRTLVAQSIVNHLNETYGSWQETYEQFAISSEYPVFAGIRSREENKILKLEMDIRSFIDGKLLTQQLVYAQEDEKRTELPWNMKGINRIAMSKNDLFAFQGPNVFKVVIADSVLANAPTPAHFSDEQTIELDVGAIEAVRLNVVGNSEGCEFKFGLRVPMTSIDAKNGIVSVDTQGTWSNFIQTESKATIDTNPKQHLLTREENAATYEALTGKKLEDDKFAIQLPIEVALVDSQKRTDSSVFVVLIKGPLSEVEALVNDRMERHEKMLAEKRSQKEYADRIAKRDYEEKRAEILKGKRQAYANSIVAAGVISTLFLCMVASYAVVATAIIIYFKIGVPKTPKT